MRTIIPIRINPATLSSEEKCGYCTNSTCCTYVTQHLDTPRSMEDFDTLLWQVSHRDVQLYKDSDGWFLLINNRCNHLQPDGRCGIYHKRPQICRTHSNEDCEFNRTASAKDFDLFFADYAALDRYCRKRFRGWDKRWDRFA
jgi:Fe-S-cluster containining protein